MTSSDFQLSVENRFDYICKRVIRDERNNYYKQLALTSKREVPFPDVNDPLFNQLQTIDVYPSDFSYFLILDFPVRVRNNLLAAAIKRLSDRKRQIVLLYYYLNMNDPEIAECMCLDVTTVNRHRNRALVLIRQYMEEHDNER